MIEHKPSLIKENVGQMLSGSALDNIDPPDRYEVVRREDGIGVENKHSCCSIWINLPQERIEENEAALHDIVALLNGEEWDTW